ncbi:hypothetical protein C7T79_07540 [Xanthomonas oryzae pv. oryzicola]|nr:hypothetical protein C7T79_07540 [Xanthomonas oryzae pv. oryzicola]
MSRNRLIPAQHCCLLPYPHPPFGHRLSQQKEMQHGRCDSRFPIPDSRIPHPGFSPTQIRSRPARLASYKA